MKVLLTTAWYPNRKCAGDGVFIQKHARAISLLHDVAVMMVQTDIAVRGCRIEMEAKESSENLHELLVYVPKTRFEVPVLTGLLRLFWLMAGYLKGYRYIKRNWWQGSRPDVCHVNVLTRAAGLPWLLYKLHKIPYIITEHWTRYSINQASFPQNRFHLFITRLFTHDAQFICPVSLNLEQDMRRWGLCGHQFVRVGNVVDTDVFCCELLHSRPDRNCRFVHVSWMYDGQKNISGILRTLAKLKQERTDWKFTFIGEGNDKKKLVDFSKSLGLSEYVSFHPAVSGENLSQLLSAHDVLVMFSNYENQPVSILEALSCGLPVLASSVGEIPSMLARKRGIVIPPEDESALLSSLSSFVSLYNSLPDDIAASPLRQARHEYVVSNHSIEAVGRRFDVLYHCSLKNKKDVRYLW